MRKIIRLIWLLVKRVANGFVCAWDKTDIFFDPVNHESTLTSGIIHASENTACATVLNDKFFPYFLVFLKSVRLHNPWLSLPWLVFYSKNLSPLSQFNQNELSNLYDKFQFLEINEEKYRALAGQTPEHMIPALFSLECFRHTEFDRIVFLDSDMLCLGDISSLFTLRADFAACMPGRDLARKRRLAGYRTLSRGVNTGVMSIGRKYLNESVYAELFKHPSGAVADQDIINRFFRFKRVRYISPDFNCHAEFFWNDQQRDPDVRLLHYAGVKPLQAPDLPKMKIWFEHRQRFGLA
ncbi:MAG: hypothetical protein JXN60_03830 [Lentisphaerae bacterium]|nr:hypothetical protein [Lentisphaerota bacterium]